MRNDDMAKLILRLGVGGLMLFHGVFKLRHGYDAVGDMLAGAGLPVFLRHGVIVGEVLAPLLLIAGFWTRPAAAVVALTMIVSIVLAFRDRLFTLNPVGGWVIELNVLFLLGAVALLFAGSGKYAVSRGRGRMD
jgi:putative oxidoreductase